MLSGFAGILPVCPRCVAPEALELAPVQNLRETRKEMTEARKRHPAGKAQPKPAPAKKAPAKAAKPAGDKPATLRWQLPKGAEHKMETGQTATAGDREYAITPDGEKWKATVKQGGKTTTLAEGSFGKCYNAITGHHKGVA